MRAMIADAFWKHVTPAVGCWNWRASVGNHGYGQLTYLQQKYTAHRIAWELHRGPIPDGLCVLHRCDNRRCCNPDHLFLGTRIDNLVDMTEKGRRVRGQKHGQHKLEEVQVREILASNDTGVALAQRYGVSKATISLIRNRHHWRHLQ